MKITADINEIKDRKTIQRINKTKSCFFKKVKIDKTLARLTKKRRLKLLKSENGSGGTSLVVQWLRLCAPNAAGPGSIPGQGTRSHMPQLRVHMLQLKILCAATKDPACLNEDPACRDYDPAQPNK